MKHSFPFRSSLSVLSLLIGTVTLAGCGGAFSMPDSSATASSAEASGPPIQGSVFGGHAPIVGAHVYLLQPGITGYGSAATSLLNNNANPAGSVDASNGYPLVKSTGGDGAVTNNAYYVTTDSSGAFNLTSYYKCTVNQPVYIYAYGGNIGSTPGTNDITYTVSKIVVTGATGGANGTATYTFTVNSTAAVPVGTQVTIAGLNGGNGTGSDNWSILDGIHTVLTAPGTTTFTISATDRFTYGFFNNPGNIGNGTYNTTGTNNIGTGGTAMEALPTINAPVNNNSIVQLATLGNCPSSGNFSTAGNDAISYIYLNEVSTVATAYTFQPFTLLTQNDAWHIGTPNPATNALAGTGIFNAAATAAQLYDIEGTQGSSTGPSNGEGHIANSQTTGAGGANTGNGVVPQATIDTLANILADCVDSVPSAVGTPTTQCTSLFGIARDDGTTTGNPPVDTATAAINIARFPAGNNSSTNVDATYAGDIYALQGSGTPYQPQLSSVPIDWTLAINYPNNGIKIGGITSYPSATNTTMGGAESIAIDGLGQVWMTAQTHTAINRYSSLGALQYNYDNAAGYIWGYVAIDNSNNAWFGNAQDGPNNNTNTGQGDLGPGTSIDSLPPTAAGNTTPATHGADYEEAYVALPDGGGNVYFFAATTATGTDAGDHGYPYYQMFEMNSGGTVISSSTAACNGSTGTLNYYCISASINGGSYPAHGAIAAYTAPATPNFWLTTEENPNGDTNHQIAYVTSTGTKVFSIEANENNPEVPAVDNSGNAWIPISGGEIYKVTSAGAVTTLTAGAGGANPTGAALSQPFGAAVDGNGNVWVTDRTNNTLIELNGTGTTTPGFVNTAISPTTNYVPKAQYPASSTTATAILDQPLNIAIDPSGNIWMTNLSANGFVEIVGAAAPTFTPLSVAAANNKLGAKP